jgi:transcription antitermination factor NusG
MTGEPALTAEDWHGVWTVAHTKPRQEKALAWDLHRLGITYFLPLVERETSSGGYRRRNLFPMFPSYVFFSGNDDQRAAAFRTDRIARCIYVTETGQDLLRRELSSLETVLRTTPRSVELHRKMTVGTRVAIKAGPLKGVEGVIINAQNKRKICLGVSALGVSVTVEIAADLIDAYI